MRSHFHASHSHLFPGAEFYADGSEPREVPAQLLITFSDLSEAEARLMRHPDDGRALRLEVSAYRTTAGTELPEKHWLVEERSDTGSPYTLRVKRRLNEL
ncbi:MAG: hypothetical protein ACK5LO_14505 [Leucobacter sp.]